MKIEVQRPNGQSTFWNLDKNKTIIGRGSKCDITIIDEGISREHLLFERSKEKIFVQDLGSGNGTTVNGKKIPPHGPTNVQAGNIISLGNKVSILIHEGFLEEESKNNQKLAQKNSENLIPSSSDASLNLEIQKQENERGHKDRKPIPKSKNDVHRYKRATILFITIACILYLTYDQLTKL